MEIREKKFKIWNDSTKSWVGIKELLNGEDVTTLDYLGFDDINGEMLFEADIVEVQGHPFHRYEGDICGVRGLNGRYVLKWNNKMEIVLTRNPKDNEDGGWLLNRMYCYITKVGNYLECPNKLKGD